jgi:putative transposase
MRKEHLKLTEQEHSYLTSLTTSGELKARKYKRVMTLLWLHQGKTMSAAAQLLSYAYPSVVNLKKNFLENRLECLEEKPRSGRPLFFEGLERAKITALACSETPPGRAHWSLRLLADKAVELDLVENISHTQVHNILKKTCFNRI